MKNKICLLSLLLCIFLITLTTLTVLPSNASSTPKEDLPEVPNYSEDSSWLAKPAEIEHAVDVFYVYPTIYADEAPKNMDIYRTDLRKKASHLLTSQAGVYSGSANLFAPFYRQMSIIELDPSRDMFRDKYFRIGADDVQRAFDYYLAHFNKDRPIILAGHS